MNKKVRLKNIFLAKAPLKLKLNFFSKKIGIFISVYQPMGILHFFRSVDINYFKLP